MTKKQRMILVAMDKILAAHAMGGAAPTNIGQVAGKAYHEASSWVCSSIKFLIEDGYVAKSPQTGRYRLTDKGKKYVRQDV